MVADAAVGGAGRAPGGRFDGKVRTPISPLWYRAASAHARLAAGPVAHRFTHWGTVFCPTTLALLPGLMPHPETVRALLQQHLMSAYSIRELRRLIASLPRGQELVNQLPDDASHVRTAEAATDLILSHGILADLLYRSMAMRPTCAAELRRVAGAAELVIDPLPIRPHWLKSKAFRLFALALLITVTSLAIWRCQADQGRQPPGGHQR